MRKRIGKIVSLLTLAVLSISLIGCGKKTDKVVFEETQGMVIDSRSTSEKVAEVNNPLSSRQIFFAGFDDIYASEESVVCLENLPENDDFFIRYEILMKRGDKEKLVFETDLIPSGEHIEWIPSESLEPGDYDLTFVQTPYVEINGKWTELTTAGNDVKLCLKG